MADRFHFELNSDGWADCGFDIGDGSVHWLASRISGDALGDLMKAFAAALQERVVGSGTVFVDPPGYVEVSLVPRPAGRVQVRVSQHDHWFYRDPGKVIFEQNARLRTLAGSVLSRAQHIMSADGEEGYLAKWRSAFPGEAMMLLKAALEEPHGSR